jgi:hypothetical protein
MIEDSEVEYRRLIEDMYAKRDGTPIPNGSLANANVLIEALFKYGKSTIRILTGELNQAVYATPSAILYAKLFLSDPKRRLEIIVDGKITDAALKKHPFVMALDQDSNVIISRLDPKVAANTPCHFATMDEDSYRFESNKNLPAAIAAFGDRQFTGALIALFGAFRKREIINLAAPVPAHA